MLQNITEYTRYLGPGQTIHGIDVSAWTAIGLDAGITGEVRVELEVDGWVPAEVSFDVSIAAVHAWEIIRSDAEVMNGSRSFFRYVI